MRAAPTRYTVAFVLPLLTLPVCTFGCNTVLGSGRYYTVAELDASSPSPGADAASPSISDAAGCDGDPTVGCYPCLATTPSQILNACTSAACIRFDNKARVTKLLPDGGLPPLPLRAPNDGGDE